PSCLLTGQILHNFALNDLNGQPWEYRVNRRGRLVLLDFWETKCVPCQYAIPHLKGWQQLYGAYGLEVVGIAYEEGTPQERCQKVNRLRQRLGINYRLLMGSDRSQCPVKIQFGVVAFPTLVLLDEDGRIIWRSEGLGAGQIEELENIIKQRLGVRETSTKTSEIPKSVSFPFCTAGLPPVAGFSTGMVDRIWRAAVRAAAAASRVRGSVLTATFQCSRSSSRKARLGLVNRPARVAA